MWQVPLAASWAWRNLAGLGLLVEKITDDAGGIAPTVAAWRARAGWTTLRARLDEFFEDLATPMSLHDVSPSNIAYGRNADGKPGCT